MTRQQELSVALRQNAGRSGRAEDLRNYRQLFVDQGNSTTLETNTNQLIVGRRGTGKTHLFGAVHDKVNSQFPERKVRAFYYSAESFRKSVEFTRAKNPTVRERTHAYFQTFIERLANDILSLADEVFEKPTLLQELGLKGDEQGRKRDHLAEVVLRLVEVAKYGSEVASPGQVSAKHREITIRDRERSLGVAASLAPYAASGKLQGKYADGERGTVEDDRSIEWKRGFDAATIRALLVEAVGLLGLDYIIIMIDEWMSLRGCQIEFAERLRQCLFGENRISVKIAADQFQGKLNNGEIGSRFLGLEIGADIFQAVDLDRPFRDRAAWESLYGEALYRRLLFLRPTLAKHYGNPLADAHAFIGDIFGTSAFDEVARGAQGNCRDFHETVQLAAKKIDWDVTRERIPFHVVREVLSEQTDAIFESIARDPMERVALSDLIIPHVRRTGVQSFLVDAEQLTYAALLDDLTAKRLIHPLPHSRMEAEIRASYRIFEIDYGIYIELIHDREYSQSPSTEMADGGSPRITKDSASQLRVDLAPLGAEAPGITVNCPSCSANFLASERSYDLKRLCPQCLELVPDE